MMYCRYSGVFYSLAGVKWEARIMQESDAAFPVIGELSFPASSPLTLEWNEASKEEVVCGSVATLKILSPGDRTYQDLYSIEVGRIRLDVYRNDSLYWSGTLDTEFYEEPYSSVSDYEVSLTFSDFGILSRLDYNLFGIKKLSDVLRCALSYSKINFSALDTSLISIYLLSIQSSDPLQLNIDSANFYDEDGVASTYKDVLTGILQPFALRVIQRAGKIYVYDLHSLYTLASASAINWASDDQMMSTDKVFNKVVITFSSYSNPAKIDTEIKYTDPVDLNREDDDFQYLNGWVINFRRNLNRNLVYLSLDGSSGMAEVWQRLYYMHSVPLIQGEELTCLAYAVTECMDYGSYSHPAGNTTLQRFTDMIRTNRVYIPAGTADKWALRLQQEMFVDFAWNGDNEAANNIFKKVNYLQIPCRIRLYDSAGNILYHYENRNAAAATSKIYLNNRLDGYGQRNHWVAGDYQYIEDKYSEHSYAWLEWYNVGDISANAAIGGWKTNHQTIGLPAEVLPDGPMKEVPAGEYIPYPPEGGYVEVTICEGLWAYKFNEQAFGTTPTADTAPDAYHDNIYEMFNYILYKTPRLTIVRNNLAYDEAGSDDVVYNARLNSSAANELKIDAICGTSVDANPAARGAFITDTGSLLDSWNARPGRTGYKKIEKILLDTLYSQFAARKTKLTGSVDLISGGWMYYTEAMQAGKRFVLAADIQNAINDTSTATLIELRPDEYNEIV